MAYMLEHLGQPLDVLTLSRRAGLSQSTFYQSFKTLTGYTPNDYLIRLRMKRACELFNESDLNVKEVAATLGYHDQFYFSRLFKSVTGIPPREYRGRVIAARERSMPGARSLTGLNNRFANAPNAVVQNELAAMAGEKSIQFEG